MPAARYGECLSQAFIADCFGARHWSKPKPRKLPGVTTFPVAADPAPVAVVTVATSARVAAATRGRSRGRSGIDGLPGKCESPWWGVPRRSDIHGDGEP